jgi:hypothetical protein
MSGAGVSTDIDQFLAKPPSGNKMDLAIGLGLIALAGLAMASMSTVEVKSKTEVIDDTRKTMWSFRFQGSEKVPDLVESILRAVNRGP